MPLKIATACVLAKGRELAELYTMDVRVPARTALPPPSC
jgi:hypothetical protein